MKKIDETLKKIAENTSRENMETSSSIDPDVQFASLPGDPNCPICHGVGFVRLDVPMGDPNFGKVRICSCRQQDVARAEYQRLYRLSNLNAMQQMTFDTFKSQGRVGLGDDQVRSLQNAYSQSVQFAQDQRGWLLLMGGYGCGKTHLAASIANHAIGMGVETIFLTVPDLLDWLRGSFQSVDSSFEERFEEIRNIDLLILDDLGTENATPWVREKIFQIINHRYINRLSTVITTNIDLSKIEDRISSRLQDTELVLKVKITAPDYRNPMQESHPQLSTLHLHNECTFGNFRLRESEKLPPDEQKSLEKAFEACRSFAENPSGWLILMGTYGCGKTHLAAAIGNYRLGLGESPMFVVVPELLDHLRATFSPSSTTSYDFLFNQVRNAPLLVLDDLGTESATPWAREKLYQVINYRYAARLPTVVTTSAKFDEIDARIRSRMLDTRLCKTFAILAPSFRSVEVKTPGDRRRRK
jgi:DNA replication protein DnaC